MSKTARRIGIVLVFVLGLGYVLFSNLVYNPFEASYMDQFEGTPEVAVEFAIPREVDFMVHKRGLASDYAGGSFPLPDLWNEIRVRKSWQHFEGPAFFCGIAGYQEPLSKEQLQKLYKNKKDYQTKVEQRVNQLIKEGWFLPVYKDLVMADAAKAIFP